MDGWMHNGQSMDGWVDNGTLSLKVEILLDLKMGTTANTIQETRESDPDQKGGAAKDLGVMS